MLFVVLVLVLAAAGLLVTALVNGAMLWAWLSVGVSVVAALVLVVDWARRRQLVRDAPPAAARPAAEPAAPAAPAAEPTPDQAEPAAEGSAPEGSVPDDLVPDDEPAEEDTDAADLLVVADLATEVRVVDERPRYHLATCAWLAGRATLGLPVGEARQLGFTPCAVCSPDGTLAAAARTAG
jgi:hypothetical protein